MKENPKRVLPILNLAKSENRGALKDYVLIWLEGENRKSRVEAWDE